jgi:hypothetical protein
MNYNWYQYTLGERKPTKLKLNVKKNPKTIRKEIVFMISR